MKIFFSVFANFPSKLQILDLISETVFSKVKLIYYLKPITLIVLAPIADSSIFEIIVFPFLDC